MKKIWFVLILAIMSSCFIFAGEEVSVKKQFSNEAIIKKFEEGSDAWNRFRSENQSIDFGIIFENKDYKQKDITRYNLKGISFKGSRMVSTVLRYSDLEGCNLQEVNFYMADLKNTNLKNADLTKANLDKTELFSADMENAKISLKWKDSIEKKNVKKIRLIDWKR